MNVCVFCGSATVTDPAFADSARQFAGLLARSNSKLIYGGGNIGLMGVIADEMLKNGGSVIGVIPDFLVRREVAHPGLTELIVVQTMHERKKRMADLADAFAILPGGMGTLDEMAEILTWRQLGLVNKPIGLLNLNGFFDPLVAQFSMMVGKGFLKENNLSSLKISENVAQLFTSLGGVTF